MTSYQKACEELKHVRKLFIRNPKLKYKRLWVEVLKETRSRVEYLYSLEKAHV